MVKKAKKKKPTYIMCVGIDLSPSSISLCAKSFDPITRKMYGPVWHRVRWQKDEHVQWDKLKALSRSEDFIFKLQNALGGGGVVRDLRNVYIGIEELPARILKANRYREQAELIGACVASLLRYGYPNVYSVTVTQWQSLVASDLDMKMREMTKFDIADWVAELYEKRWRELIYNGKRGLIPKPKTSKAKSAQPDDRVDATGIMEFTWMKAVTK